MSAIIKTVFHINTTFQIIECKPNPEIDTMILKNSLVYELESNHSFFCVVAEKSDELKTLISQVSSVLDGSYLFVTIVTNTAPFIAMGISNNWLKEFTPYDFDRGDSKVERLLSKIQAELSTKYSLFSSKFLAFHKQFNTNSFKRLLIHTYCSQFIFDFVQFVENEINENDKLKSRGLEVKRIMEIQHKIVSELNKTLPTVKEMAVMAGMSVSKFKILFNDIYEESPHQHILERKLLLAKELLQTGNYSISQVSYKVGFNHPSGFTRLFKNKYQYPPSTFYNNMNK
jgi:AraC-like DNA-binding protein